MEKQKFVCPSCKAELELGEELVVALAVPETVASEKPVESVSDAVIEAPVETPVEQA